MQDGADVVLAQTAADQRTVGDMALTDRPVGRRIGETAGLVLQRHDPPSSAPQRLHNAATDVSRTTGDLGGLVWRH